MTLLSLFASVLLAFISFTRIDSICVFCMTLYAINLALFALVVFQTVKTGSNPLAALRADLKAVFSRLLLFGGLTTAAMGTAAAFVIWFPPYWHQPGWSELPNLSTGIDSRGRNWIGAQDPVLVVEEFSDYQCPHCRRAHKYARMLTAKYADSVRLVHRHLPLDSTCNPSVLKQFHERACEFSKAAECAAEQGAFWKMNDAIFSMQDKMKTSDIDIGQIAAQLGLDRSSLEKCMEKSEVLIRVQKDIRDARQRRVAGTPTFFIGSQAYQGSIPEKALKRAVEKARSLDLKGNDE
jgi:predicted DsbA family dithiol-disulfide isomerase